MRIWTAHETVFASATGELHEHSPDTKAVGLSRLTDISSIRQACHVAEIREIPTNYTPASSPMLQSWSREKGSAYNSTLILVNKSCCATLVEPTSKSAYHYLCALSGQPQGQRLAQTRKHVHMPVYVETDVQSACRYTHVHLHIHTSEGKATAPLSGIQHAASVTGPILNTACRNIRTLPILRRFWRTEALTGPHCLPRQRSL